MMILYSTHTSPTYMPPLVLSKRQIVVGPNYPTRSEDGRIQSLKIPHGRYDMAALISSLPANHRPELIVVLADSYQQCVPENLAAVPCRRILLVADTHHGQNPLQKMLAYARQEPFDQIVLIHDPHHLHWFTEAGIAPTVYIPNPNVHHFPRPFNKLRQPAIAFVGSAGSSRRRYLLQTIEKAGLPLVYRQIPAPDAAAIYNAAQITFNCSLNADLNMRVFEVMAAGGFLITDRLSPQAGLDTMFRRGKDYVDYDGPDDLIAKLKYYLDRPKECLKIARSGQAAYLERHTPAQRVRELLNAAAGDATSYSTDRRAAPGIDGFGENLDERVLLYEVMQTFAQQAEQISVAVDPALGARCIADLVDLPRLKISVVGGIEQSGLKDSLVSLGVFHQVSLDHGEPDPCDVMVLDGQTVADLTDAQRLRTRFLLTRDLTADKASCLAACGFIKVGERPMLFERR